MTLAVEPEVGQGAVDSAGTSGSEKTKVPPPVQKIHRLRGFVLQTPSPGIDGFIRVSGDCSDKADVMSYDQDAALKQLVGAEVRLRHSECGQLQLQPNDEVAFCCVNMATADGQSLEAQRIDLLHTSRADGSVLGCFTLSL